jgi:DNA repair/transcription protein MET18/MMS19
MDLLNPSHLNPTTIRTIFAILKGLVLRNSTLLSTLYPALLSFLSISPHSATVAHGFTTLLQPDDLLTKANHCMISGLHKQKTFNLLVPNIAASFRDANKDMKPNYLIALSGVLRWLPFNIVSEELGQLVPLLLQSLDLQGEDGVKEAAVGTLTSVLAQNPKAVEEHAGSLITRLLNTVTVSGGGAAARSGAAATPARVRAVALKCLAMVPAQLRQEIVLPYRRQVVKKLTGALDDKKRGVRAEAVRCRARWLEVDEVWEDED